MDATGRVYYFGENEVDNTALQDQIRIEIQDYVELADLIVGSNFLSLDERYIDQNIQDATWYTIKIYIRGKVKPISVICNNGQCPNATIQIRDQILKLWGKEILNIGI